jgi:flavin reductase (DIM6/NTAB) family NADH-FMN oxidoreductase RutF
LRKKKLETCKCSFESKIIIILDKGNYTLVIRELIALHVAPSMETRELHSVLVFNASEYECAVKKE